MLLKALNSSKLIRSNNLRTWHWPTTIILLFTGSLKSWGKCQLRWHCHVWLCFNHNHCILDLQRSSLSRSHVWNLGCCSSWHGFVLDQNATKLNWVEACYCWSSHVRILVIKSIGFIRMNQGAIQNEGWFVLWTFCRYLFGFFLWNIDNIYCDNLKSIRSQMPYTLTPLTQLHGWWHILAGYATHLHIQNSIHHRQLFLQEPVSMEITWMGIEASRAIPKEKTK